MMSSIDGRRQGHDVFGPMGSQGRKRLFGIIQPLHHHRLPIRMEEGQQGQATHRIGPAKAGRPQRHPACEADPARSRVARTGAVMMKLYMIPGLGVLWKRRVIRESGATHGRGNASGTRPRASLPNSTLGIPVRWSLANPIYRIFPCRSISACLISSPIDPRHPMASKRLPDTGFILFGYTLALSST